MLEATKRQELEWTYLLVEVERWLGVRWRLLTGCELGSIHKNQGQRAGSTTQARSTREIKAGKAIEPGAEPGASHWRIALPGHHGFFFLNPPPRIVLHLRGLRPYLSEFFIFLKKLVCCSVFFRRTPRGLTWDFWLFWMLKELGPVLPKPEISNRLFPSTPT